MCGISCIVALHEATRLAHQRDKKSIEDKLRKSLEQIRHRGPDSTGTWISEDGRVALGHVRLDINDLSPAGCQPLHSTDDTVHVVVNGEIYDYDRLRADMEEKINYQFQGTSDSELVLALYKYYDGLSFLDLIRGEFSICLFDSERKLFVAVRDRYGIKPLFWTIQAGQLLVAAEMKAFLPMGWKPEWDVNSIVGGHFQIGSPTIFKKIQKLCLRTLRLTAYASTYTVREQKYWDSRYPDKKILSTEKHAKDPRTEGEMIQGVRERLVDAIKERLRADVKVGVSLSGGIDSSVVAGVVNHLLRQGHQIGSESVNGRLSCFGIAFDEDSGFDESSTANRTADFLGVKFYKKHMTEDELARSFADATWHDEQPNPDLNFIGTYALSALFQKQGFRVNINGQGADEIFGGYNIFLPDLLREPDTTFDGAGVMMTEEERIAKLQESEVILNRVYYGGQLDLSGNSVARSRLNNILTPVLMAAAFPRLPFKEGFSPLPTTTANDPQLLTYTESIVGGGRAAAATTNWHPLHTAQYVFVKGHLQNLLLSNLGDRGEMAHSIEGRTPFLDHYLTEYVDGLPPSVKIRRDPNSNEWVEKYLLREAGRPFITDEVYKKQKHPYSAPLKFPRGGPMYNLLKELVTDGNISKLGFLRHDGIGKLVDEAFETDNKHTSTTTTTKKFRIVICLAQWVVLQRRFGVQTAIPETKGQVLEGAEAKREEETKDGSNVMIG
ncbi:hypothetical protein LTS17_008793 [Exophiala oligosperma]